MSLGKTCLSRRSDTDHVRLRASNFLVWLQAFNATIAHAAPAASQSSDSTPRALSRGRRADDADDIDSAFIVQAGSSAGPLYGPSHRPTRSSRPRAPDANRSETFPKDVFNVETRL